MRHIVFLFILFSAIGYTQGIYINYGYNGSITNLSGINAVVDNYNDSRKWLDDEMGHFGYLDGFAMSIGGGFAHFWFDTGFDIRGQKQSASGTDLYGNYNTRELKVKNGCMLMNFGIIDAIGKNALGFGLRTEIGTLKTKTRVFGESFNKDKFEDIGYSNIGMKLGPMVKFFTFIADNGTELSLGAYYTWSMFKYNYTNIDEILNNTDYNSIDQPKFDVRPNAFGIHISVGFYAQ